MNQSKTLTDGALLTALYIVLLLVTMFVPLVEIVAMFLLPVPFIIFASKYDWKPSLLMLAVALALSSIFPTLFSVPATILMGLGGIMIGSSIYKQLSPYETLARGTFGFIVGLVFIFVISQLVFDVNIVQEVDTMIDQSLNMSKDMMDQLGFANMAEDQLAIVEQQIEMFKNLIPVGIAIAAVVLALISQWAAYKVINRLENKNYRFPAFRNLTLPVSLIWIYFFVLILTLFELDQNGIVFLAVNNVLALTGFLMMIQGFSFIFYYAHRKNMSKALPVWSIIFALLLPPLLNLVRLLGIIDLGFRLRDRISQNK